MRKFWKELMCYLSAGGHAWSHLRAIGPAGAVVSQRCHKCGKVIYHRFG